MKKLMFVAALAATAALWADGLESANTVGYQTMDLTAGKQVMKGAMFVTVGDTALSLQDIRMDAATTADGGTRIWWWNKDTRKYTSAFWCLSCNADGDYIDASGNVVKTRRMPRSYGAMNQRGRLLARHLRLARASGFNQLTTHQPQRCLLLVNWLRLTRQFSMYLLI